MVQPRVSFSATAPCLPDFNFKFKLDRVQVFLALKCVATDYNYSTVVRLKNFYLVCSLEGGGIVVMSYNCWFPLPIISCIYNKVKALATGTPHLGHVKMYYP